MTSRVFGRRESLLPQELRAVTGVVAAALAWEALSRGGVLNPAYFPPTSQILQVLWRDFLGGDLALHTLATLGRLGGAFLLASLPGLGIGILMGLSTTLRRALDPYVAFLYPLPKVALLPLLLILLGVGNPAFVVTGSLTAFFQIVVNTMDAVRHVDPLLVEVGRNYGARGFRLFWKVLLPAALPGILTGLRLGLGLSLVTLIAVEFAIAKSGLGHLVWRSWQMLATPQMFAALLVVGGIGILLTRGLKGVQDRLLRWHPTVDVWA
ncbi:MAG: ABC transporter permease [Armatimonadetes bacterium]|nr:ABC transporter permease [Armatimonadota bacterium]MDW8154704.1 ABC transporter permease [Armatimonadota bacterium]